MTKEVKAALIGGICTIVGGVIGIFSVNINADSKINDLIEKYEEIQAENSELKEINNSLQDQINLLIDENQSLHNN